MSSAEANTVEQLKAAANDLYLKGDYEAAHLTYSQAIEEDSTNPTLFANRAQTDLAMKKYPDAVADAQKAVDLDPKFCKAWGRLATAQHALAQYSASIDAWQKALLSLPAVPGEAKLRSQFESGLRAAQIEQESAKKQYMPTDGVVESKDLPWNRALAMKDALLKDKANSMNSSAWIIMAAYKDFSEGVRLMNGGGIHVGRKGELSALTLLSNGILRDSRVFHMNLPDWVEKYNRRAIFENKLYDAWLDGGVTAVQEEAMMRLQAKGWDDVRAALSVTVRGWIVVGLIASNDGPENGSAAMEYFSQAIGVLQWGRNVWQKVPREQKGEIFDSTFLRGVKRLFLSAFVKAYTNSLGPDSDYDLDDLYEMTRDYIKEVQADPPKFRRDEMDPGFLSSFWLYPQAEGFSILGFVHMRKGLDAVERKDDKAAEEFTQAAKWYSQAGQSYPQDDEKHVFFLAIAMEALWRRGTDLGQLLPLCSAIREGMPEMKRIWEYSPMAEERNRIVQEILDFEDEYRSKLKRGECTLKDVVCPVSFQSVSS